MKITLAQLNPTIGKLNVNREWIKDVLAQSQPRQTDIVVFPELSITGYFPRDMIWMNNFVSRQLECVNEIVQESKKYPEMGIVLGAITKNKGKGKPYHNSLLFINDGEIVCQYNKRLLPDYNIFNERRYFAPGDEQAPIIEFKGRKIGFLICEDIWYADTPELYEHDPIDDYVDVGLDHLITIHGSPGDVSKRTSRSNMIKQAAKRTNAIVTYVNQVGGHDEIVFDGGSMIMHPDGKVCNDPEYYDVCLETHDTSSITYNLLPPVSNDFSLICEHITCGLRDYMSRCGFKKIVVGCSGGVDSALTLALAYLTVGPNKILAVTMPSTYSSSGSVTDSQDLCNRMGIELRVDPISDAHKVFKNDFSNYHEQDMFQLTEENLQARIRGVKLMALSNQQNYLLLTTGNKSEASVGYCTLYGDTNGGLNLIGDLYKTEVFELCRWINQRYGDIIPTSIIDKPPSAELSDNQQDTDSLPPYDVLDPILKVYIEGTALPPHEYAALNNLVQAFDQDMVKEMHHKVNRAEYKRRQSPPIIRIHHRSFGFGRQMPIAAHYRF